MKDYYKTLGVSEGVTQEELKKVYRKLSKEHHPDTKNGDDVRFKEINEAYDTLADDKKRQEYDMLRKGGPRFNMGWGQNSGFNPFGHDDFFEDVLRRHGFDPRHFRSHYGNRPRDGKNITIHIKLSIEEAFTGKSLNIPIKRNENGRLVERTFRINIKKGFRPERSIVLKGEGHYGENGGRAGDIVIIPILKKHSFFKQKGVDLECEIEVFFTQAILGDKVFIKHPSRETIEVNIPRNSSYGDVITLKNRGYPISENSYGNLYVKLKIKMPKELNMEEKRLIEEYHKQSLEKNKEFNF